MASGYKNMVPLGDKGALFSRGDLLFWLFLVAVASVVLGDSISSELARLHGPLGALGRSHGTELMVLGWIGAAPILHLRLRSCRAPFCGAPAVLAPIFFGAAWLAFVVVLLRNGGGSKASAAMEALLGAQILLAFLPPSMPRPKCVAPPPPRAYGFKMAGLLLLFLLSPAAVLAGEWAATLVTLPALLFLAIQMNSLWSRRMDAADVPVLGRVVCTFLQWGAPILMAAAAIMLRSIPGLAASLLCFVIIHFVVAFLPGGPQQAPMNQPLRSCVVEPSF